VSERKIKGPVCLEETINPERHVRLILITLFKESTEEKMYGQFMQDSAWTHTSNFSVAALQEVFGERLTTRGLRPPRSPDLNPCAICGEHKWGIARMDSKRGCLVGRNSSYRKCVVRLSSVRKLLETSWCDISIY
jgi:hypothetical protein